MKALLVSAISLCVLSSLLCFSPLTSFSNLRTEKWRLQKEFVDLAQQWKIQKDYGVGSYSRSYYFFTETVNIDYQLSDIYNTFDKHDLSVKGDSLTISGDDIMKIEFNLKYSYNWSFYKGNGQGKLLISVKNYNLVKSFDDKAIPNVVLSFENGPFTVEFTGDYATNSEVQSILNENVKNSIQDLKLITQITSDVNSQISQYYTGKNYEKTLTTYYPQIDFKYLQNYNSKPKVQIDGVIYYREHKRESTVSTLINTTWDNFNADDGPHQIFYHQDIFNEILAEQIKNHRFGFRATTKNTKNFNPLLCQVGTLAKFYPDILANHSPDETYFIFFEVTDMKFVFTSSNASIQTTFRMTFTSDLDQSTLFQTHVNASLLLDFATFNSPVVGKRLHWNFVNNWNNMVINGIIVDPAYSTADIKNLEYLIHSSFAESKLVYNFFSGYGYPVWDAIDDFGKFKYIDQQGLLVIGSNELSIKESPLEHFTVIKEKSAKFLLRTLN